MNKLQLYSFIFLWDVVSEINTSRLHNYHRSTRGSTAYCHRYQSRLRVREPSWYRIILHSLHVLGYKCEKKLPSRGLNQVTEITSFVLTRNPTIRRRIVIRGTYTIVVVRDRDHWLPLSTFWYKMAAPYGVPSRNLSRFKLTHAEPAGGPRSVLRGACAAV